MNVQISGYPELVTVMAAGSELLSTLPKRQVSPGTSNCTTSFPGGPAALGGPNFPPSWKIPCLGYIMLSPHFTRPSFLLPLVVGASAHIPGPSAPVLICFFGTVGVLLQKISPSLPPIQSSSDPGESFDPAAAQTLLRETWTKVKAWSLPHPGPGLKKGTQQ